MKHNKEERVFVAMSGGVDSSVAAALLKREGFRVVGVFMKVWNPSWPASPAGGLSCSWPEERRDAMRVAIKLGIPFLTFDFSKEYKKRVIDYMIAEYKAGRTPNPDVMCNKEIKFGMFLDRALAMGADFIATGHYVRKEAAMDFSNPLRRPSETARLSSPRSPRPQSGHRARSAAAGFQNPCRLLQARDPAKDQSYFLWTLTQDQLKRCLFPIGEYTKPEVRSLAKKFGLPTAEKKDSQGLCFLGKVDVKDFLKRYIKTKKGNVLDETGRVIGDHEGVELYTIGERHGFRVIKKSPNDKPLYVIAKDLRLNTLVVSESPNSKGQMLNEIQNQNEVKIINVNWISGAPPNPAEEHWARIRYRQALQVCKINKVSAHSGKVYKIRFEKSQTAVTSGQSLVIYTKDGEMLGGGVIV